MATAMLMLVIIVVSPASTDLSSEGKNSAMEMKGNQSVVSLVLKYIQAPVMASEMPITREERLSSSFRDIFLTRAMKRRDPTRWMKARMTALMYSLMLVPVFWKKSTAEKSIVNLPEKIMRKNKKLRM